MDVIIVCHTEFGFVHNKKVVADKNAVDGVKKVFHKITKKIQI